jgi:hypothetical protein
VTQNADESRLEASASGFRRADGACLLAVLALAAALWIPRLQGPIDPRSDAGVYYILGTSLYEGKGYRLLNEPGEIRAVQYPPLLPAVVAAHQAMLGTSDFLVVGERLRLTFFALSLVLSACTYLLARSYLAPPWALVATAVASLCLNAYCFSDLLYTELPFAVMATLMAISHQRAQSLGGRAFAAFAGAAAVAAYLLRAAGLALLASWVGESVLRRRFKQAAARLMVASAPIGLWQGYVTLVTTSTDYRQPAYAYQRADYYYSNVTYAENTRLIDPFRPELGRATAPELLTRSLANIRAVPAAIGEAVSVSPWLWRQVIGGVSRRLLGRSPPPWVGHVPVILLGAVVAAGALVLAARGLWFVPLCLASSVAMICLSPWPEQFPRYLTPMVPFMSVFLTVAIVALRGLSRRLARPWGGIASVGGPLLLATVLVVNGFWAAWTFARWHPPVVFYDERGGEHVYRLMFYGPEWQALDASLEWARRHAGPGDVVATTVPHTAYVRTGLRAVMPPLVTDATEARLLLDAVPVRFVVIDSLDYVDFSRRYAAPAVRGDPARWRLVYSTPASADKGAHVYERVREPD